MLERTPLPKKRIFRTLPFDNQNLFLITPVSEVERIQHFQLQMQLEENGFLFLIT